MNRTGIITGAILMTAFATALAAPRAQRGFEVADSLYWAGPEKNVAYEITGKFQSEEKLVRTLCLDVPIGQFQDRKAPHAPRTWKLRDVLVSVDLNSTGSTATWRISGPKPLLTKYVDELKRQSDDKSLFYDFGYQEMRAFVSTD